MMLQKILLPALFSFSAFAFADEQDSQKSRWSYSLTTNAAIYPKAENEPGRDHFASVVGPYDGVKAITEFDATYTIPTPLGDNFLLKGANVEITASAELSPVTIAPALSVSFTPVPFLVFGAGAYIGSGWGVFGFQGMSAFEKTSYEDLTPFAHYYYETWVSGTFQFDTGALIEGDWSHVVLLANYKLFYGGLTGVDDGVIYDWQTTYSRANGLQYLFTGVLGYRMPIALNMVGLMVELEGHFDEDDYGVYAKSFDGDFMLIDLSLLLSFTLNKTNSLTTLFTVEGDRSYDVVPKDQDEKPFRWVTGREWTFYQVAFSWTHKF